MNKKLIAYEKSNSMYRDVCFISKAQSSLPEGKNQEDIIFAMNNYERVDCKWVEVKNEGKFIGYQKVIEIIPKDTLITHIYFFSNAIKKKNMLDKIEVMSGEINGEIIEFIVEVDNPYSIIVKKKNQFPLLELEMTKWLKKTSTGTKIQ
ncbi:MAG: hypothetical protein NT085_03035 [candidate division SR1 bacterium]|nr:hypothetical protein [candidate division SR1 bacterium]